MESIKKSNEKELKKIKINEFIDILIEMINQK